MTSFACPSSIRPWGYYGGARAAVEHRISHGHRRVGMLAQSMRIYTMTERCRGYRDTLADAGIAFDPSLEAHAGTAEEAHAAMLQLLAIERPPTGLFCANDRMGCCSGA